MLKAGFASVQTLPAPNLTIAREASGHAKRMHATIASKAAQHKLHPFGSERVVANFLVERLVFYFILFLLFLHLAPTDVHRPTQ